MGGVRRKLVLAVYNGSPGTSEERQQLPRRAGAGIGLERSGEPLRTILVGDQPLPTDLLVSTAALEIAVHGWDVGQATGLDHPLPDDLARRLLPVARRMVADEDRAERFSAPVAPAPGAGWSGQLLGYLGRARQPVVNR